MFPRICIAAVVVTAALQATSAVRGAEMLPGPYAASIERVVDGDTLAVRVTIWLQQDIRVLVRVRGVDAPEIRGRCESEKSRAAAATAELARLVADGPVILTAIEGDKYFGRVVADVATREGGNVGAALLAAGVARAYDGGARQSWCEIGARDAASESELAQIAE
jgi:endonuclease YncB( thermonuclease family)